MIRPSLQTVLTLLCLLAVFAAPRSATGQLALNPGYTEVGAGLVGAYPYANLQSPAAWGDFNDDGRLDLVYAGLDFIGNVRTYLYRQEADHTFTQIPSGTTNLPDVDYALFLWADVNGDDFPDLLVSGDTGGGTFITKIYRNVGGTGAFVDHGTVLPTIFYGVGAAWADYDEDGDPDLLIATPTETDIYRNTGGNFAPVNAAFPPSSGSVAWGDYDGDGDLDAVITR